MICILKMEDGQITGWIMATDPHDARRQAHAGFEHDLVAQLYRLEFTAEPGKYQIGIPANTLRRLTDTEYVTHGYLMLVS